jgi:16S rRNA (guanine966-N2)-methyltransferase
MRIVGGELRGRRISVPSNFPSRPTTDYAKEGLFNVLENQLDLTNYQVLDLCSGTGNISLEFISRGASKVTCVDIHMNCVKFILKNAQALGIENKIQTRKMDIISYVKSTKDKFDLVFADPPYAYSKYDELILNVFNSTILHSNSYFILEHSKQMSFESKPNFVFYRNYGNVTFSFFKFN